ncbi:uncharacterized protein J3D65DRAFT_681203 [Phyllosticta citribraziliensis]|uniref:Uncharacterized protein n=1 Tax=Phyllosticta citribraziliensis TaxID=989973 RepID=A0ABR1L4Y4_9PEZI
MEAYNRSRKKVSKFAKPKNGDKSTIRRRRAARHSERRNAEASRSDESNSSGSTRGFFARFRKRQASPTGDNPTKKTVFSPFKTFANKKISALKARFATRMPTIATLFAGLLKPKSSTSTPVTLTPEPQVAEEEEDYQHDTRQQLPRPPSGGLLSAVRSWECCSCGGTTGYNNYFCPECGKKRCGSCSTTHEPYV